MSYDVSRPYAGESLFHVMSWSTLVLVTCIGRTLRYMHERRCVGVNWLAHFTSFRTHYSLCTRNGRFFRRLQPSVVGEGEREGVHGTERVRRRQDPIPCPVDHPERRGHLRRAIVRDAGAV